VKHRIWTRSPYNNSA